MKKLIILLLASLFVFAACSNGNTGGGTQTITYIGTKAPGEAKEVGDIVFNDGSATHYTSQLTLTDEQKTAAIAIIFYKGTDLNSENDTTTIRTLGFGLKHGAGLKWCTSDANAYGKDLKTINSNDKNGSDNLTQIATFLSNPSNNTTNDTEISEKYPAFYFAINYSNTATNLGSTYASGWYLPSKSELYQIYENGKVFDIYAASDLCGGDGFGTLRYWSSTMYQSSVASVFNFKNLSGGFDFMTDVNNYVCAIREFN